MDNPAAVPDEIHCAEQIFDLALHPKFDFLAAGLIDGTVEIHKYDINLGGENKLMMKSSKHSGSCRGLIFSGDGERLYTISSDRSLMALNGNGETVIVHPNAHDDPINKIISVSDGGVILATGDDAGCVKLWDVRTAKGEVMSWELHEDFVSGFAFNPDAQTLLSVAGDATLCTYDIRKEKNSQRSDDQEAELHCVSCMKGGKKVICGTQEGVILFFSWGRWGDCSDRFPGHPEAVDCMLKIDESTILTGSSDGLIRVVALQPNKVLGVIGDHEEFPVEGIQASRDGRILASFAHDEVVRFWDISMFADDIADVDVDDDDDDDDVTKGRSGVIAPDPDALGDVAMMGDAEAEDDSNDEAEEENDGDGDGDGQWEDMGDDDGMSTSGDEDSDDSDEDRLAAGGGGAGRRRLPTAAEKFFADL